jgi:microcystin-dependent protein
MAEPFLSEIRIMSFNFAPRGWAMCNGQLLPINQNQALFSLLGTTYGGNAQTTFALPDLRGRVPIHAGSGHTLGEHAGETSHTLTRAEMPQHVHPLMASLVDGTSLVAPGNLLAKTPNALYHAPDDNLAAMNPAAVAPVGGTQPHENMMPYLTLNFCIALQGIFPSRN